MAESAVASHKQLTGMMAYASGTAASLDQDDSSPLSTPPSPPCLVTFEGSARGLHFEGVEVVFVVGRPSSLTSYLHLAGRVGRHSASGVNPGTVVSMCTSGTAKELESWVSQLGGSGLEPLELDHGGIGGVDIGIVHGSEVGEE